MTTPPLTEWTPLVTWPGAGFDMRDSDGQTIRIGSERYRDSGEGGLFAYAVWESEGAREECNVDVHPGVHIGDVLVTQGADRDALFEDDETYEHAPNMTDWTDPAQRDAWQAWEHRQEARAASVPLHGVLFLGSTHQSLYDDYRGVMYSASRDDLTDRGRVIIDALDAAYGRPARFLTYLDT